MERAMSERRDGEMPFLDHLEELRWRIIYSLAAVLVATFGAAFELPVLVLLLGRDAREDVRIVPRRRMAEEDLTDSHRRRPRSHEMFMGRSELLGGPPQWRIELRRHSARLSAHSQQHFALAVAADISHGQIDIREPIETLSRHRPRHHIAANHDLVDTEAANVRQHRIERR
jgi:hypothetical protein